MGWELWFPKQKSSVWTIQAPQVPSEQVTLHSQLQCQLALRGTGPLIDETDMGSQTSSADTESIKRGWIHTLSSNFIFLSKSTSVCVVAP